MSRPDFGTIGSTVSACEAIVQYLKPFLEATGAGADRVVDRVQVVERHIGQFDTAEEIGRWMGPKDGGVRIAAQRVTKMENQGNTLVGNLLRTTRLAGVRQYRVSGSAGQQQQPA